jgi:hypothetical protein
MFGELATESDRASRKKKGGTLDYRRFVGICCHPRISVDKILAFIPYSSLVLFPVSGRSVRGMH